MAWLLIISSFIVLWVASLFKILLGSFSHSKGVFLTNGGTLGKRNVLLVVAHPDDESMQALVFFSLTLSYLTSRGHNPHILCLSTGDADGKGDIRKEEHYHACAILKVPLQQVKFLDHPDLQDGFGKVWDHNLLAKIIGDEVISHDIDLIITFDSYSVSGHYNHSLSQRNNDPTKASRPWDIVILSIILLFFPFHFLYFNYFMLLMKCGDLLKLLRNFSNSMVKIGH
ncbi:hypothetical protein UlMin_010343 [Ulmus minor]